VMVICRCLPVALSLADTFRMPLASMSMASPFGSPPRLGARSTAPYLPLLTSGRGALLDHPGLVAEFLALDRRVARAGASPSITPERRRDDLAKPGVRRRAQRTEAGLRWPVSRGSHEAPTGRGPRRVAPRLSGARIRGAGDRVRALPRREVARLEPLVTRDRD
jgi:hypothetical protein